MESRAEICHLLREAIKRVEQYNRSLLQILNNPYNLKFSTA